jgi:pyruvate kinase
MTPPSPRGTFGVLATPKVINLPISRLERAPIATLDVVAIELAVLVSVTAVAISPIQHFSPD